MTKATLILTLDDGTTITWPESPVTITGAPPPTEPPVDPPVEPPTEPPAGTVTWKSVTQPYDQPITIRGVQYSPAYNLGKDWPIKLAEDYPTDLTRFEVRANDRWANDPASSERSEFDGYRRKFPYGTTFWGACSFFIEPGAEYKSSWTSVFQMHGSASRVSTIHYEEGRFKVRIDGVNGDRYNQPLARNQWHSIVFQIKEGSPGTYNVWLNGAQIVNFSGAFGRSGNQAYWKFGIYRGNAPLQTVFAVQYANMEVGTENLTARINSPLPT